MRIRVTLLLCLLYGGLFAQNITEKEILSDVNEVTVFIDGAQITRIKEVELAPGKTSLKFSKLSPYIEAKTVQVKADNGISVLSVHHQQNYINKIEKSDELKKLEATLKSLINSINIEETNLQILREEIQFLHDNRVITGANQSVSVLSLKEASEFYGTKIKSLMLKELELNQTIDKLNDQREETEKQIRTIESNKEASAGEIIVNVETSVATKCKFEISYTVENAGWFPSYDIRANSIDKPIELVYKANVRQNTKVDWKNVKLHFSSSEPSSSGVAPVLQTYKLGYNTMAPRYNNRINSVSGYVTSTEDGLPVIGASISVPGTTIVTTTNIDGYYSITLPANSYHLSFSSVGYESQTLNIKSSTMNVSLRTDTSLAEEVVVAAYGVNRNKRFRANKMASFAAPDIVDKDEIEMETISMNSDIPMQAENQTSLNFEINKPYSIKSDNKTATVDMVQYNVAAQYKYYSVPKIDKSAFLIANITDWEKFNLLEGEANIFFEGTFVGKSLLDTRSANDTLQISLGKDKSISISREKVKDFTNKQIIGTKKEETRNWKTTVKNNKSQDITIQIFDQVPISTNQEIEVSVGKTSGAKHNLENGEIKWEFTLNSNSKKELDLNYSVKYPKNKKLVVE